MNENKIPRMKYNSDGYGSNGKVLVLKDAVNLKDWGITIDKA